MGRPTLRVRLQSLDGRVVIARRSTSEATHLPSQLKVAFSIMVRNGDAHPKNFGVLHRSPTEVGLAPISGVGAYV